MGTMIDFEHSFFLQNVYCNCERRTGLEFARQVIHNRRFDFRL